MNQIGDKRCGNPIKDNGCSKTQIKGGWHSEIEYRVVNQTAD
jgi:hypothetical protein